jgi:hypothetical protein
MDTKTSEAKQTVAYVEALQNAVLKSKGDLPKRVADANARLAGGAQAKSQLYLRTHTEGADGKGDASLRVTCPSRSVVSAEIPNSLAPEAVEFYMTRTRVDGVAETRLLGTAKYKDSDGKWNVTFNTERFARRREDAMLVHAEVFGNAGLLIAAQAIAVVD